MPMLTCFPLFTIGDIVAFDFPYSDDGGSKIRTCAIVAVDPETREVVVAYGSKNFHMDANVDYALAVFTTADRTAAGLHERTRFQIDRRIRVRADDPRFDVHPGLRTAKLGHLNPAMRKRLAEIYRRLPSVSAATERKGIHPPRPKKQPRRDFLGRPRIDGRRKAGQGGAAALA